MKSVVYASSAAACGPAEDYPDSTCHDDDQHMPRTHYGVFKLANEGNARIFWSDKGLSTVGLRPLTVYGVGRELGMTSGPTKAIKAGILGRSYAIQFAGKTVFNYVADIADLFIRCAVAAASDGKRGAWRCNIAGTVASAEEFALEIERQLANPGVHVTIADGAPSLPFPVIFDQKSLETLLDGDVRGVWGSSLLTLQEKIA